MECTSSDRDYMRAAIRLSVRHLGLTATNPSVGAVIVARQNGLPAIVAAGVTEEGGRPHAEAMALAKAGARAKGATIFVTLEPCSHFGQTPPCAQALIEAQVARVVIALLDPDPRVAGRGVKLLQDAGIDVVVGVESTAARNVLNGYLLRTTLGRPEVTLKMALSRDHGIGKYGSGSLPITNFIARARTHILRMQSDAILVGVNTVISDNPYLTCRLPGLENRSPVRIVIDPRLQIPLESNLVQTASDYPLWLVASGSVADDKRTQLEKRNISIITVAQRDGRLDNNELVEVLGKRGIAKLLVEGGTQTAQAFLDLNLVDRVALFTGKSIIGNGKINPPEFGRLLAEYDHICCDDLDGDSYNEWLRSNECLQEL